MGSLPGIQLPSLLALCRRCGLCESRSSANYLNLENFDMPAINGQKCGICGQDVVDSALAPDKSPYRARDVRRLSCAQCGIYEIARPFYPVSAAEYEPLLPYLAAHIRQANELEKRIPEISSEWPQLAELHRNTSVRQRAEKLLRTIEARAKDPGAFINLDPARDFPLVDSLGEDAIHYYAEYWESVGCLEMAQNQAISDTTMRLRLTVDGWSRLDPIASGGIPGRVFVAMSFNPDLDQAFENTGFTWQSSKTVT